jgi:putative RNA 2'-phosphotransferase
MNYRWLSRYLCYVLRHNPQDLGIELDERGWTDMTVLLERLSTVKRVRVSLGELERLALGDRRRRYSIEGDRIRANEGHTLPAVRLVNERVVEPPQLLFYGLSKEALDPILKAGALEPGAGGAPGSDGRILLTESASEADRRSGCSPEEQPYIVVVEAARAAQNGIAFWRSEQGHYLCERLPMDYFLDQRPDFRFQVSAGGVVVRNTNGRYEIAVMHTRKRWELPKGKLEKGERGWEAARREVQEELGLTGFIRVRQRLDRVLYFFRNHVGQPRLKTVLLFLIHYKGPPGFRPRKREGVLAADWVSFTEAKDRLLRSGGRYLRALEIAESLLRHRSALPELQFGPAGPGESQTPSPAEGLTASAGPAERPEPDLPEPMPEPGPAEDLPASAVSEEMPEPHLPEPGPAEDLPASAVSEEMSEPAGLFEDREAPGPGQNAVFGPDGLQSQA